jgi:exopolysaccharide production protein ExoF
MARSAAVQHRKVAMAKLSIWIRPLVWLLLCLAVCAGTTAAFADSDYRLSLSDKLTIRVVEWQDADSSLTNWTALAGDYVVGADGHVTFPYAGSIKAAGETTTALAAALRDGLRQALGLTDPPDISVEVTSFGPVYVTGAVKTAGAYPYAPGLSVIKLVSLAGGTRTSLSTDDRDVITMQGTYDVLRAQRVRLLIHVARLDASLAGKDQITLPAEIDKVADIQPIVTAETAEMTAESKQLSATIGSFDSQQTILSKTLDSLGQKQTLTEAQLKSMREQLDKTQGLVDNGLAVAARVSSLQTSVTDLETRLLDIQTAQLRAEQDLAGIGVQREKASSDRFLAMSQERQQTSAQLAEVDLKIATQERLIVDASGIDAAAADADPIYQYTIQRGGSQIAATDNDPVLPGDVVTVGIKPIKSN